MEKLKEKLENLAELARMSNCHIITATQIKQPINQHISRRSRPNEKSNVVIVDYIDLLKEY